MEADEEEKKRCLKLWAPRLVSKKEFKGRLHAPGSKVTHATGGTRTVHKCQLFPLRPVTPILAVQHWCALMAAELGCAKCDFLKNNHAPVGTRQELCQSVVDTPVSHISSVTEGHSTLLWLSATRAEEDKLLVGREVAAGDQKESLVHYVIPTFPLCHLTSPGCSLRKSRTSVDAL